MVEIEASGGLLVVLVVVDPTVAPIEMANGIEIFIKVEISLLGLRLSKIGGYGEGVARHVEREARLVQAELREGYLPIVRAGGGVFGNGVAQGHIELGVGQDGMVDVDVLLGQVDAVGLQAEQAYLSLDAERVHEVGGVDLHLLEGQLVDHDLAMYEGPQLHVDHHRMDVGNGVGDALQRFVGLKHAHLMQR